MAAMDARKKKSKSGGGGGGGGEPLLGKYELGRMLGRGTFAKVYLARAVAGGEAVAVKVIDKAEDLPRHGARHRRRPPVEARGAATPAYAAPEVLRRRAYDGAKADAWSCGVILFVLLAGYLPFDDSNIADMCRKAHRREYELPRWVSQPARRLVSRLLDPNPDTRVAVESLATHHPWFKRSLSVDSQLDGLLNGQPERAVAFQAPPPALNAFDIISMSPGLDLSGLFGEHNKSLREKRFMTTASPEKTLEQLGLAGGKLGYVVVGKKGVECLPLGGRLSSGIAAMSVEMSEVAPPLMLVELRLEVAAGDGDEVQGFGWEQLRVELGDVVRAWHSCEDLGEV
uniref:non-specific serine/threonine protein kinase n=1 Tax=Oryza punctata TaxID=4537 RepID=A0A0E0MPD4_ORYPU